MSAPIDLDHFCWRERVDDRLLVPHSDPMVYEFPVDLIFATADEAIDFRAEHYEDETDWVLVHHVGTIVPSVSFTEAWEGAGWDAQDAPTGEQVQFILDFMHAT